MACVLLLLAGWNGQVWQELADMIEYNEVLNKQGSVALRQIIAWEWSPDYRRLDCLGYEIVDRELYAIDPRTVRHAGVTFRSRLPIQRTRTQWDPEIDARAVLPPEQRPQWPRSLNSWLRR